MAAQSVAQGRQELQAQVDQWAGEIDRWSGVAVDARAEEASVRARAADGGVSLDELAAGLTLQSGRAEVADEAAQIAVVRLSEARRALLAFDVEDLVRRSARLATKLAAHEARTAELLAPLLEHEGPGDFVPTGSVEFARARDRLDGAGATQLNVRTNTAAGSWKSHEMRHDLRRLELQADVARDVLAGIDHNVGLQRLTSPLDGTVEGWSRDELLLPSAREIVLEVGVRVPA